MGSSISHHCELAWCSKDGPGGSSFECFPFSDEGALAPAVAEKTPGPV